MKERGFGGIVDNLSIMSLQAPFDIRLNYLLMYMICLKFLIHFDNKNQIRGPTTGQKIDKCSNSHKFIKFLMNNVPEPIHPLIFIDEIDIHDSLIYSQEIRDYEIHKTKLMLKTYLNEFSRNINKKVL